MPTINFYLQTKRNPAGIYIRLRDGKNVDAKAKTKYSVNPKDWDNENHKLKHIRDEELKELNLKLRNFETALLNHHNNCVGKVSINSKWLKDFISPPVKEEEVPSRLIDYFDYYLKRKASSLSQPAKTKLNSVKRILEKFEKEYEKKVFISEVNLKFGDEFYEFSLDEDYNHNYIAKNISFIKTICYRAAEDGILLSPQIKKIKFEEEPTCITFLDEDELNLIYNTNFEQDYLDNAKDWLLLSCETAQRASDFLNFRKGLIRIENGRALLEFTQKKTKKKMSIPLSTRVKKILDKRHGEFPRKISASNYNVYIKEVCKIAGISNEIEGKKSIYIPEKKIYRKVKSVYPKYELIASHVGRRSFSSNNFGIIPTQLIMVATGHKYEKDFLKYIGKTDTTKTMQLAEYIK